MFEIISFVSFLCFFVLPVCEHRWHFSDISVDAVKKNSPGGGSSCILLAIWVYAAGKGVVFKLFALGQGLVIIENWSRIGSHLTGSLTCKRLKSRM